MSSVIITPVVYGMSTLPENMVFAGGNEKKVYPIDFKIYLLQTEEKNILVDAGCITMPGFDMKDFIGPIKSLENLGIYPNDITDVVITHSHHDHIECVNCFENSVVHIQKDEYESGKNYLLQNKNIKIFDDNDMICHGVEIKKIGGHSKGSCIVEITDAFCENNDSDENKIVVIVGDECYKRECIKKQIPTGCSYCPEKSTEFIKKYSNPKYNLLYCHD